MLVHDDRTPGQRTVLTLVVLLAVVFALGRWSVRTNVAPPNEPRSTSAPALPGGPFDPRVAEAPVSDAGLEMLAIELQPEHEAILQRSRDEAMARGYIVTADAEIVPARVSCAGAAADARVRLKGDFTDHVDSDKWSLRIELEGGRTLLGMSAFSIQHPKTRGYLMQWLVFETARREGLLAPRATYVDVTLNGRRSGVYFLEEHFTKEMLESQGRRDGPIVRLDEDLLWTVWRQFHYPARRLPEQTLLGTSPFVAETSGFDERRLATTAALGHRLQRALEQLRDLQRHALVDEPRLRLARLDAIDELRNRIVDDLFVSDKLGRLLAMYSMFRSDHGLMWIQLRFYHDPVLDRLEPVVFDTGSNPLLGPLPLLVNTRSLLNLGDAAREIGFRELARMARPEFLRGVLDGLRPQLARFTRALDAEGLLPPGIGMDSVAPVIAANCATIRELLAPLDPAHFAAKLGRLVGDDGEGIDVVEVDAWATSETPVAVHEFTFSNGRTVRAADALGDGDRRWIRPGGRVVLPPEARRLTFTVPVDVRLATLRDIQAIKRAIRAHAAKDESVKVELDVTFAPITVERAIREPLRIRSADDPHGGRPPAPTLEEALARHACLEYDLATDRLSLRRGTFDVDGDLSIPAGYPLAAGPGTVLRFAPGVMMVAESAVRFVGTEEEPVRLLAADQVRGFGGVLVLGAEERSRFEHVEIAGASELARGPWQSPGGVTFHRSPVDLVATRIEDARGEDALNIVGADFLLESTTLRGGPHDLFDGDFVTGTVRDCTFADSGEDAIDVSGSRIEIVSSRFDRIADKALSIGEASHAVVRSCEIGTTSIGLAVKDRSSVDVDGLRIARAGQFGIAVFVKKPEFGPSTAKVSGLDLAVVGRKEFMVQTGCALTVEGRSIPTEHVDVEDMYRRQILGK
jgi:hypothetical protein